MSLQEDEEPPTQAEQEQDDDRNFLAQLMDELPGVDAEEINLDVKTCSFASLKFFLSSFEEIMQAMDEKEEPKKEDEKK